jgi:AmmeMemoRadiSam system protein A
MDEGATAPIGSVDGGEASGPPDLDEAADAALLRLARAALEVATGLRPDLPAAAVAGIPERHLGAFVTLTIGGDLRGCMGRLDFDGTLAGNVVAAAYSVVRDPRFEPLSAGELDRVRVEVSAITEPVPIPDAGSFDPLRHGIVVERGWRRALLLPQVARERGWDARQTLRAVCEKAGLDADAWRRSDVRLLVFAAHEAIESASVQA